ncbi:predicted protein [Chaetoceros tenuissimus]|uniref:Uncharacterized protein n=1 Tax=Chaetoceros tenuissimus TaxID=426638 RepID=A0AAD3CY09_9STRA|nr:predicted protein [Chaetoceros tenuissimus]
MQAHSSTRSPRSGYHESRRSSYNGSVSTQQQQLSMHRRRRTISNDDLDDSSHCVVLPSVPNNGNPVQCICGGASHLEEELGKLRESTRIALQTSWNEVEELQQKNTELQDEIVILKQELEESRQREKDSLKKTEQLSQNSSRQRASYGSRSEFTASVETMRERQESWGSLRSALRSSSSSLLGVTKRMSFPLQNSKPESAQHIMHTRSSIPQTSRSRSLSYDRRATKQEERINSSSMFRQDSVGSSNKSTVSTSSSSTSTWPFVSVRRQQLVANGQQTSDLSITSCIDEHPDLEKRTLELMEKDEEIRSLKFKLKSRDENIDILEDAISVTISNMQKKISSSSPNS